MARLNGAEAEDVAVGVELLQQLISNCLWRLQFLFLKKLVFPYVVQVREVVTSTAGLARVRKQSRTKLAALQHPKDEAEVLPVAVVQTALEVGKHKW
jgi:hypothetical protein